MNTKNDIPPSDLIEANKAAGGDCVSRLVVRSFFRMLSKRFPKIFRWTLEKKIGWTKLDEGVWQDPTGQKWYDFRREWIWENGWSHHVTGMSSKELADEMDRWQRVIHSSHNDLAVAPPPQRPATGRDVPGG